MINSRTTFNFPSLPYHIQKRFAELVETQTAQNFFKTNQAAAEFSSHRTIIPNLKLCPGNKGLSCYPAIKDFKCLEVAEKVEIKQLFLKFEKIPPHISIFPISFSKLIISTCWFTFHGLKIIIEHPKLKEFIYDGYIDLDEKLIPMKIFNAFFDRLTKIRKIRLSIYLIGSEKNRNGFMESVKTFDNSLKTVKKNPLVIFTRHVYRRTIYDL